MIEISQLNCPTHKIPITHICTYVSCKLLMAMCEKCKPVHDRDHQQQQYIRTIDDFVDEINDTYNELQHNKNKIINTAKNIQARTKKKREEYQQRFTYIRQKIKQLLEIQVDYVHKQIKKEQAIQKIQRQNRLIAYFNELAKNNLLQIKLKMSSQQGLATFTKNYEQYRRICGMNPIFQQNYSQKNTSQIEDVDGMRQRILKSSEGNTLRRMIRLVNRKRSMYQRSKQRSILQVSVIGSQQSDYRRN